MTKTLVCAQCGRQYAEPTNRCSADGSALCGPEALTRINQRLGNYDIIKIEGVGGMGVVYLGKHTILGKPVAIKVLHERYAQRDGAVDQFLREAQAATRIRHPNIVDVTDFGIAPDKSVYFVMELLEGISLEDVLARDGKVQLFNAVNIVRQAARALAAAHEEGIVHRDLKPENIFLISREGRRRVVRRVQDGPEERFVVEKEGNFDFVKLLDFGVAKYTLDDVGPGMSTRAGMIFGTPHYMSPEQARGELVDGRSDIYALGIVFYEMITGAVPFDGEAALDILNGHVYGEVIPPKSRNPGVTVDEGTNETILRCLAKRAEDRFQTMWELVDGLQHCFTDQVYLRDAARLPGALEFGIVAPEVGPAISPAPPPPAATTSRSQSMSGRPAARPPAATPAAEPATSAPTPPRRSGITAELSELFGGPAPPPPPVVPDPAPTARPEPIPLVKAKGVSVESVPVPADCTPTIERPRVTEEMAGRGHSPAPPPSAPPDGDHGRTNTSLGLGAVREDQAAPATAPATAPPATTPDIGSRTSPGFAAVRGDQAAPPPTTPDIGPRTSPGLGAVDQAAPPTTPALTPTPKTPKR